MGKFLNFLITSNFHTITHTPQIIIIFLCYYNYIFKFYKFIEESFFERLNYEKNSTNSNLYFTSFICK
jgi:hypothetical protein